MKTGPAALVFLALSLPAWSAPVPGTRFGHLPYAEAPAAALSAAGKYRATGRVVRMRPEAARAFRSMVEAARADGVSLIPISGFRPVSYQKGLWDRSVARRGSEEASAKWVAPPGHSEHHTGWTLDVGDGDRPETDVETSFENTETFRWLATNAGRFHFELSFPKNNPQGVSYEPWHWRFVGTEDARRDLHRLKD